MAPTLVVLTGRAASAATAGRLPAVVHRVVSPPVGCERISIPYFLNPDLHARVGGEEYGWNALDVLIRSHMDVARRHHPDLVAARERRVAKGDA
jgi:isopenicillin N synthase-like dioxygenase